MKTEFLRLLQYRLYTCDEHDEGILFFKLMIIQQTYACVEVLVLLGSGLYVRIVSPFFKGLYTFVSNASVDNVWSSLYILLSFDVASGSEMTPFNKIDKPLVV